MNSEKQAETVEEAAMREMEVSPDGYISCDDKIFIGGAIFGAKWQASQPNLISREAVTELIESRIKTYRDVVTGWGIPIQTISSKIEELTELLTTIKQL